MKKTTQKQQDPLNEAVRALRTALGESQQAFAYRMQTAIRTIARYESSRPPKGKALAEFSRMADDTGHHKLAAIFRDALMAELGPVRQLTALGLLASTAVPRIRAEIADVAVGLKDESLPPEARIAEAVVKLDAIVAMLVKKFRPYFPKPTESERGE